MTQPEFIAHCETRLIDVSIALENDQIQDALLQRDDSEVLRLLDREF